MPALPRAPMLRRVLAWTGFALSPVVLHLWIAFDGSYGYAVPILAVLLLAGVPRRRPWAVLGMLLAESVSVQLVDLPPSSASGMHQFVWYLLVVAVDLAVGHIAATRRLTASVLAAVGALAVQVALGADAVPYVLAMVSVWALGTVTRQRGQYRAARQAQAELNAVQAERLRIARELHDMIAHSIGVIAFQAGMGNRVIDTQPAQARAALCAIEDTSRDTLAGLRRMLGALRRSDVEPGTPLGMADLDNLVARSLDAGVRVAVEWRGDRRPLPPDIDLSVYRIIQESVTNVTRHAGTDACAVVVERRDGELTVEVTDNGRGGGHCAAGYGIRGMRERVALLDGEFTAGPRAEGGFRVTARIPVGAR